MLYFYLSLITLRLTLLSYLCSFLLFSIIEYFSYLNLWLIILFLFLCFFFLIFSSCQLLISSLYCSGAVFEFCLILISFFFIIIIISPALIILLDYEIIIVPSFIVFVCGYQWAWTFSGSILNFKPPTTHSLFFISFYSLDHYLLSSYYIVYFILFSPLCSLFALSASKAIYVRDRLFCRLFWFYFNFLTPLALTKGMDYFGLYSLFTSFCAMLILHCIDRTLISAMQYPLVCFYFFCLNPFNLSRLLVMFCGCLYFVCPLIVYFGLFRSLTLIIIYWTAPLRFSFFYCTWSWIDYRWFMCYIESKLWIATLINEWVNGFRRNVLPMDYIWMPSSSPLISSEMVYVEAFSSKEALGYSSLIIYFYNTNCILLLAYLSTLRFIVFSYDVIHSFSLYSFGIKMDCIPGKFNVTSTIRTNRLGEHRGLCYELCGYGHSTMLINSRTL